MKLRMFLHAASPPTSATVRVRTSGTRPQGIGLVLERDRLLGRHTGEYRGELSGAEVIASGLLPASEEDGVPEFAYLDYMRNSNSNFNDGRAFRLKAIAAGFVERGIAEGRNLDGKFVEILRKGSDPGAPGSTAPVNHEFTLLAGTEAISAEFAPGGEIVYAPRLRAIENQADLFYYSGHGFHESETMDFEVESTPAFPIGLLEGRWAKDLDMFIMAGCSLVDVKNFNEEKAHATRTVFKKQPGLKMAKTGCPIILGYNGYAPADATHAGADFTKKIIERFMDAYVPLRARGAATESVILAWIKANSQVDRETPHADAGSILHAPFNACGIDASNPDSHQTFYYYLSKAKAPEDFDTTGKAVKVPFDRSTGEIRVVEKSFIDIEK